MSVTSRLLGPAPPRLHRWRYDKALYCVLLVVVSGCLMMMEQHLSLLVCRYITSRTQGIIHNQSEMSPGKSLDSTTNGSLPSQQVLRYLIEEAELCHQHPDLEILAYVHSAIAKVENRQLIRNTWGNLRYYPIVHLRVVFVFGRAANLVEQEIVQRESQNHHDIIQLDFVDTYKNLSYKGVGALQWVSEHCMSVHWILKSDDDMVINVFALAAYLHHLLAPPSVLLCAAWYNAAVVRSKGCGKWCLSKEEWPESTFPTYCSGSAAIIPTALVPHLYYAHFNVSFLWVDDVYIMGVLPQAAGVKHYPVNSLYEFNSTLILESLIQGNRIFCHHPGDAGPRADWWQLILAKESLHIPHS